MKSFMKNDRIARVKFVKRKFDYSRIGNRRAEKF